MEYEKEIKFFKRLIDGVENSNSGAEQAMDKAYAALHPETKNQNQLREHDEPIRPDMYQYEDYKWWPCSAEGQKQFLAIRDKVHAAIKGNGCVSMKSAIAGQTGGSWEMLACVDRLLELGEISEIKNTKSNAGQHRIFVPAHHT